MGYSGTMTMEGHCTVKAKHEYSVSDASEKSGSGVQTFVLNALGPSAFRSACYNLTDTTGCGAWIVLTTIALTPGARAPTAADRPLRLEQPQTAHSDSCRYRNTGGVASGATVTSRFRTYMKQAVDSPSEPAVSLPSHHWRHQIQTSPGPMRQLRVQPLSPALSTATMIRSRPYTCTPS